jgi:long-chain acyl-CoA synthetase
VVGQADPEWGETIVAFIVAVEPKPSIEELNAHCLEHIARFKRPKVYRFITELPKNNYGKVLKTELRALLAHEVSLDGDQ